MYLLPAHQQAELKKLIGTPVVPVLAIGTVTQLKGYKPDVWSAALDDAGYPKIAPYVSSKPKEPAKSNAKAEQKPAKPSDESKKP